MKVSIVSAFLLLLTTQFIYGVEGGNMDYLFLSDFPSPPLLQSEGTLYREAAQEVTNTGKGWSSFLYQAIALLFQAPYTASGLTGHAGLP